MSGQHEVSYNETFTDDDRMRVRFTTAGSQVIVFTVQYEALLEDHTYPVVRYDTAHGFAHRDLLDWDGNVIRKDPLPAHITTLNEALTFAIDDLQGTWRTYRDTFLRRKP